MSTTEQTWRLGPTSAPLAPLVKGLPLLGNALTFGRDPVKSLLAWHREHGPIFRIRVANRSYTVLGGVEANRFAAATRYEAFSNHDAFIGLINDLGTDKNLAVLDGDEHARFRAVAQSSYSRSAMARFIPAVHATLERFVSRLAEGDHFEVFPALQRLTSMQLGEGVAQVRIDDDIHHLQTYMRTLMFVHVAGVWPAWNKRLPGFRRARAASHAAIDRVLEHHVRNPVGPGRPEGLIDKFLAAHREDPVTFPLDAVRAAAFGPFLAGQDTVAATTAYMLAAIFSRPELREMIQSEVDGLFADGIPDAAAFKQATVLTATVRETLRLYPVAPFVPKNAACEFEFGGYRVTKGESLFFFQARSHFEPEYYKDPWTFDIQRPVPKAAVFAPFGVGPHTCIGAGMGELQVITNVASLMHLGHFDLYPADYVIANRMLPLSPRGFCLKLTRRRAPVAPSETHRPEAVAAGTPSAEASLRSEDAERSVHSLIFGARRLASRPTPSRMSPVFVVPDVDIDAPLERVWEVLRDWERYPEWHPLNRRVTPAVRGDVGETVVLEVSWGPYRVNGQPVDATTLRTDLTNTERITIMEAPYCLAWGEDRGALHRADRVQYLTRLPGDRTRYHTDERMVGLLSPLIAKIYGRRIFDGLATAGEALKRRVEALYPRGG